MNESNMKGINTFACVDNRTGYCPIIVIN